MPHSDPSASPVRHRSRRPAAVIRLFAILLFAAMLQPLAGSPVMAQESPAGLPEEVLQASVRIITNIQVTPDDEDEDPFLCMLGGETVLEASQGSGTIISEDGYILTNHHVVDIDPMPRDVRAWCEDQAPGGRAEAESTWIAWVPDARGNPAEPYRAEVVRDSSPAEELAVMKITEHADGSPLDLETNPFPFVQFGDSDALREPEHLILVGYPANAGTSRRVSEGIFSGWGDNGYGVPWIYTDATISGGNSGGTAVNSEGLFIGIPTIATISDCRPGDTNNDGLEDENDQGCIGIGGNYGILIPGNIARVFAEEAIGADLPVAEPATPVEPNEPTPTQESPDPANADGPPFGAISFTPYDAAGVERDSFENVTMVKGCFENLTAQDGQDAVATWYLDDEEYLVIPFVWDDAWNPEACAEIHMELDSGERFLDPGVYRVEVETSGQTVVSDDVTVTRPTFVDAISFRGRTADGEAVTADGNAFTGELVTLNADITFTGMIDGSIWQAEWYRD
nr:trypsin-like peptidase domain-containing protein [Chloroflexia bacterium]